MSTTYTLPRADNTVDTGGAATQISRGGIDTGKPFVVPLPKIATRVRPIGEPRTGKVQAVRIDATSVTGGDVTLFQSGDSSLGAVEVTVAHIVKRAHVAPTERNLGIDPMMHLAGSLQNEAESDMMGLAAVQITSGAYGAADATEAAASLSIASGVKPCITGSPGANPRTLILPTAALISIASDLELGADGLWHYPGIDGGIFECSLAGAAGHTVVAGPTALCYHSEKPSSVGDVIVREITLPNLQVPAWIFAWYDRATRTMWISVESLFGVAPARVEALAYVAAP